ncbi:AAA family ATPase [Rhizobium lusitanum]|uniref:AAA domain-containing protein, putative AbiEii toxin, Type IV TA system n=1 Tax=Rhizobium lusitanum TaxID=293958 RepID=A0A1C3XLG3_9HYPH|nr:AAA family ATPase [Rhizobium lusitanum]SCB53097.1 AAA domain-containing protein, putative AbiEii toxin, Type IV TA system [Rhizobium lusitanum]
MATEQKDDFLTDLVLRQITIKNYRGSETPLVIDLERDANFLVGRNGTGKTSLINLIYWILAGRHAPLFAVNFSSAEIVFSHPDRRYSPTLFVERHVDSDDDPVSVTYRFKDAKSKPDAFNYSFPSKYYRRPNDPINVNLRKLRAELQKRFQVTWLALNRSVPSSNALAPDGSKIGTSEVDTKIQDTIQRLSTYVTKLGADFSDEVESFQKQLLLSFLVEEKDKGDVQLLGHLDLEEEKVQLTSMLRELKLLPEEYIPKVDRHISAAKTLTTGSLKAQPFTNIIKMYDIWKLHGWVDKWRMLQSRRNMIFHYKDLFLKKLNEMLYRKVAFFDSGNILRVKALRKGISVPAPDELIYNEGDADNIDVTALSSGEKQLIILLAETLLRERRPYIYIADEPELSLHIEWQEKLVPLILEISPQAQIFFATHSPDIVNRYGENVFSMEELVY